MAAKIQGSIHQNIGTVRQPFITANSEKIIHFGKKWIDGWVPELNQGKTNVNLANFGKSGVLTSTRSSSKPRQSQDMKLMDRTRVTRP